MPLSFPQLQPPEIPPPEPDVWGIAGMVVGRISRQLYRQVVLLISASLFSLGGKVLR
jgi:hypothetical protein